MIGDREEKHCRRRTILVISSRLALSASIVPSTFDVPILLHVSRPTRSDTREENCSVCSNHDAKATKGAAYASGVNRFTKQRANGATSGRTKENWRVNESIARTTRRIALQTANTINIKNCPQTVNRRRYCITCWRVWRWCRARRSRTADSNRPATRLWEGNDWK